MRHWGWAAWPVGKSLEGMETKKWLRAGHHAQGMAACAASNKGQAAGLRDVLGLRGAAVLADVLRLAAAFGAADLAGALGAALP